MQRPAKEGVSFISDEYSFAPVNYNHEIGVICDDWLRTGRR